MRVGSLFTGYGGLDLAVGGELAWYAEIDKAACQILADLYPGVPNLGDITKIDWTQVEPVDVLTGGYPCQPFSHAGNRKGKNDERHLWPYVRDAIDTLRPEYAVLENVSGHLTLGFANVLSDLATIGFDAEWGTFRASDVGAPHQRKRLFIIAYPNPQGIQGHEDSGGETPSTRRGHFEQGVGTPVADTEHDGFAASEKRRSIRESIAQGWGVKQAGDEWEFEGSSGSQPVADTSGDGHGEQLHAPRIGTMESEATVSTQQRERSRRESDAGSVDDAADTDNGHGQTVGGVSGFRGRHASRGDVREMSTVDWGKYAPAIQRWESVLDHPAPAPTVQRKDKQRLNPVFVEWMMGLREGHVTGHGLTAAQELKMLGNGVVPQQARAAVAQLMERIPA